MQRRCRDREGFARCFLFREMPWTIPQPTCLGCLLYGSGLSPLVCTNAREPPAAKRCAGPTADLCSRPRPRLWGLRIASSKLPARGAHLLWVCGLPETQFQGGWPAGSERVLHAARPWRGSGSTGDCDVTEVCQASVTTSSAAPPHTQWQPRSCTVGDNCVPSVQCTLVPKFGASVVSDAGSALAGVRPWPCLSSLTSVTAVRPG